MLVHRADLKVFQIAPEAEPVPLRQARPVAPAQDRPAPGRGIASRRRPRTRPASVRRSSWFASARWISGPYLWD